ncbi:hypothetical protein CEV34_3633 [Brucella pseudogrignonensis]|uniref:Uncharacterized protein n=1 Tax=Brucella pseudogrignonensis TaxID=419475 RepID=A0A256G976_9HYPH|nr:hypothetical protein CEV34_3633 [Brucella pseudogrignonensis]
MRAFARSADTVSEMGSAATPQPAVIAGGCTKPFKPLINS